MNNDDFRDLWAAGALAGLISKSEEDEEDLRHRYHVLAREAYRAANEMVEFREKRYGSTTAQT